MIRAGLLLIAACAADDGGPRLESVLPDAAGRNATVMITGSRLCGAGDCTHVAAAVQLGLDLPMIDAAISSYSDSAASVVVPATAPIGNTQIIVTVAGRSSNSLAFEVTP